jgi:hypothetical protein
MFVTNVMCAWNPHVRRLFNTGKFQEVAERSWLIHDHIYISLNAPIVGERAYLDVEKCFGKTDQFRDLDPAFTGRQAGYQVISS